MKCFARSFKQRACCFPSVRLVNRASRYDDALFVRCPQHNDLLGVSEDSDIGVMGNDYNLPTLLGSPQDWDDALVNEFAIKIVLRLVDDQRRIAVGREHDGQQDRLLLAKR